jgi:5'-nucleotidase
MIILVDMDGVLADFEQGFINIWKVKHPDLPYVPVEERNTFYTYKQYPKELRPLTQDIVRAPNFFAALPPIEGALQGFKELAETGHDIAICSSPLIGNPTGASDKYDWIEENLGDDWVGKLILAPDKTMVRGDILIDDRPEIKGSQQPLWEHVLYDHLYNQEIEGRRRLTWANWREVIPEK